MSIAYRHKRKARRKEQMAARWRSVGMNFDALGGDLFVTRNVVAHHLSLPFWGRVRWLLLGTPKPKPSTEAQSAN